jgi:hypothetical protein
MQRVRKNDEWTPHCRSVVGWNQMVEAKTVQSDGGKTDDDTSTQRNPVGMRHCREVTWCVYHGTIIEFCDQIVARGGEVVRFQNCGENSGREQTLLLNGTE